VVYWRRFASKLLFMNAQKYRDSIDWLFVLGVGMSLVVAMDLLYAVVNLIIKAG